MDGIYSNLVAQVSKAMYSDDDDQSEMLAGIYLSSNEVEKDVLDRAFTCLCGWSLKTLMDKCEKGGDSGHDGSGVVEHELNRSWHSIYVRVALSLGGQLALCGSALSSAFAMRVCQPGPVAFQRARMLLGIRSETAVFGSPTTGRPRLRSISSPIWRFAFAASGFLLASRRTRSQSVRLSPRRRPARICSLVLTVAVEPRMVDLPLTALGRPKTDDTAAFTRHKRHRQHA